MFLWTRSQIFKVLISQFVRMIIVVRSSKIFWCWGLSVQVIYVFLTICYCCCLLKLLCAVKSTHHSHHPSPLHSFTPGLKLSFSVNLSHHSLPFLLLDWLHEFPGLFADTSEHIRFHSLVFLFSTVSCCSMLKIKVRLLIACQNSIFFHIV